MPITLQCWPLHNLDRHMQEIQIAPQQEVISDYYLTHHEYPLTSLLGASWMGIAGRPLLGMAK